MKKWTILFRTAEIILAVIFAVTLYFKVSDIVDQWHHEKVQFHLKSTADGLAEWVEKNSESLETFKDYYLSITKLCAMYLQAGQGEDDGEELARLKKMVGGGEIFITDRQGRILAGTTGREPWFDQPEYATLFGVTQEEVVRGPLNYYGPQEEPASGDAASPAAEEPSSDGEEAEAPAADGMSSETKTDDDHKDEYEYEYGYEYEYKYKDEDEDEDDGQGVGRDLWNQDAITSAWIDTDRILIMQRSPQDFVESDSWKDVMDVIDGATSNPAGHVLCYLADGGVLFHAAPAGEETNEGFPTLEDLGLPMALTRDGYRGKVSMDGRQYNCETRAIDRELIEAELILAVLEPAEAMLPVKIFLMSGAFLSVIAVILLMNMYARALVAEEFKKIRRRDWDKGRVLRKKLFVVFLLGSLLTVLLSGFGSILYVYGSRAAQVSEQAEMLADDIDGQGDIIRTGSRNYIHYADAVTQVAAGLLSRHEGTPDKAYLQQIADIAHAKRILLYGPGGMVTASNLNYAGLRLPADTDTPAGRFRWVLYGSPVLVMMEEDTTFLEEPYYLTGAPLVDREYNYTGFLQFAFSKKFFNNMVESGGIPSVMEGYRSKQGFTYMAVDMETKVIVSTERKLNGLTFDAFGNPEVCLKDGYMGFLNLDQVATIGSCAVATENYAFVCTRTSGALLEGLSCGVWIALYCVGAEVLAFLLLLLYAKICSSLDPAEVKGGERKVDGVQETEKRMLLLVHNALYVVAALFVVFVFLSRFYFGRGTTPYFIFAHEWANGLNIFSFLRCVTLLCTAILVLTIMTKLFTMIGTLLSSRQETVIRMAMSFLKYIVTIGALVLCAGMLGAPASSLLAVSGVAALMFSMGAQSLVADIISGLFIIFEGTYKVGDMITVDDWHGQVVEIGIRNTKIRDLIDSNVKIMNNSTIKNIINFSVYPSWCPVKIGIDYDQDIREVERIFEQEKAILRHNLPPVQSDIVFLGVDEFQDSCMLLKFQVQCRNQDFLKVKRALNREIKQMFDRHGITVPFPQVVLSSRQEASPAGEAGAGGSGEAPDGPGGEEEKTGGQPES